MMEWEFRRNPVAISVMVLVISVNIGVALSVTFSGDDIMALLALDGRSIFIPALLQLVLVLIAYLACKRPRIPVPS